MPKLSEVIFGKKQEEKQIQKYDPAQQQALSQMLQMAMSGAGTGFQNIMNILGGGEEAFTAFESPIKRQFQEEIIPEISEQFAGAGALDSSGFGPQLARASEGLSETLSAQRANLQSNAMQQLMQMLGVGLGEKTDTLVTPGSPGILGDLVGAAGKAGAAYMGKPA